jgi:2-(1,2-epoxy-1,2-dihydrophenyl)acetyl-CoA isomerase
MSQKFDHENTGSNSLLAKLQGDVLILTINRPHVRNALTYEVMEILGDAICRAEIDPTIKCLVLTGAGHHFCSGGDISDMVGDNLPGERSLESLMALQRQNQRRTVGRLYEMSKPTLAIMHGAAAGAGLSLALACDLRIMSTSAFMTTAFSTIGFCGDYGASFFLTQLAGPSKARELLFLADRIDAGEAHRIGLANLICPEGELAQEGLALAERLASRPSLAVGYAKQNINRAVSSGDVNDCLDIEATINLHLTMTEEHQDSARAFLKRRNQPSDANDKQSG